MRAHKGHVHIALIGLYRKRLPLLLTLSRGALGPVVVALAYIRADPSLLAACVVFAFASDISDGALARRLGVATPALRRADSIADSVFYVCALWAVWLLHPRIVLENAGLLLALAALECTRYAIDLWKFGREASYHMWSSKAWGVALFAAFMSAFAASDPGYLPAAAIVLGILCDLEGLAISIVLPAWRHDIPTIVHAWRMRGEMGMAAARPRC